MILYIAICIVGIYEATDSLLYTFTGKDLSVYFDMLEGKKAQKYLKPIIFCTLCMSSFWGLTLQLTYGTPLMLITNLFAICGVVRIVTAIIDKLDK